MTITITRPAVQPIAVTGAALRSVQAADAKADAAYGTLTAAAQALSDILQTPVPDATTVATALVARNNYQAAYKAISELVPRHRGFSSQTYGFWPCLPMADDAESAVLKIADRLRDRLVAAGVPMEEAGVYTVQYWLDAAARGC